MYKNRNVRDKRKHLIKLIGFFYFTIFSFLFINIGRESNIYEHTTIRV